MKGQPFLETPHLDALAAGVVHFRNAFVTTSLCSPSRATILTGRYAHAHRVVDNNNPVPAGTTFFPQYLRRAEYQTAFVGKWHMGGDADNSQPGFDLTTASALVNPKDKRGYRLPEWAHRPGTPSLFA